MFEDAAAEHSIGDLGGLLLLGLVSLCGGDGFNVQKIGEIIIIIADLIVNIFGLVHFVY